MGCVNCTVWPCGVLLTGWWPLQMCYFPDLLGRLVSTSLFYFKSSWEDVRAAAPMLTGECPPLCLSPGPPLPLTRPLPTGFLVLHVELQQQAQVDLEQLIAGEQHPAPKVRAQGPPATPTCLAAQGSH